MQKRRVVVTGIGVISPFGTGTDIFWKSLIEGKSGIRPITHFDASAFDCKIAGTVINFNPLDHFSTKEARHLAPFVKYAVVSSREAITMAKLDLKLINLERMGVLIGSGIGCLHTLEEEHSKLLTRGPSKISPFFIPKMIINEAAGQVSIETGAKGPATCVVTACASATNAIGDAYRFIQYGDADIMLAGGTECAATPLGIGGFCALKALSQSNDAPEKASRPFDLNRNGFVMADGAGVTLLETLEHAKMRGANILAEVVGYGRTSDAYHITAPEASGLGAARAMKLALDEAGLQPKDLSYINAHGTSTYLNDKVETLAVKSVFQEHAKLIPMSSTKSMTGHLLGAAGGIEFAASVMTIQDNIIAPTINLDTPDPECDLDYVPNHARKATITTVMSNSLGFGGHNASLLIKRFVE